MGDALTFADIDSNSISAATVAVSTASGSTLLTHGGKTVTLKADLKIHHHHQRHLRRRQPPPGGRQYYGHGQR